MNKSLKQQTALSGLIALIMAMFITTAYAATTYWDEYAANFGERGLTRHNCSYCYGGKAKYTSQSGDYYSYNADYGWHSSNTAKSAPSYYLYIPNYSGQSGTAQISLASNVANYFPKVNQNTNKGSFYYIGGFAANILWDDVYYTNECASGLGVSCTDWRIVWWDQVKVTH